MGMTPGSLGRAGVHRIPVCFCALDYSTGLAQHPGRHSVEQEAELVMPWLMTQVEIVGQHLPFTVIEREVFLACADSRLQQRLSFSVCLCVCLCLSFAFVCVCVFFVLLFTLAFIL